MKLTYSIVICFMLFFAMISCASAKGAIRVVVDAYNPPNHYVSEQHAVGLYPALLQAVFKKMGEPLVIEAYPWKRAFELALDGYAGLGGAFKNKKRLELFDYSAPLYEELLNVYVRKERAFPFKSLQDLRDKKVGVVLGWSYGDSFDAARQQGLFNTETVIKDFLNFKKLHEGRLDCVIASQESARFVLSKWNYSSIIPLDVPLSGCSGYLVFAKSMHRKKMLLRFNKALAALRRSGEYQKIINRYLMKLQRGEFPFA